MMAAKKKRATVARAKTKSGARPRCACGHAMSTHAKRANDCRAHGCKCSAYVAGEEGYTPAEQASMTSGHERGHGVPYAGQPAGVGA
jgi:hypothetical protein